MPNGTLYFHSACFDGLVSAAITSVFLETDGWQLDDLVPVGYDARKSWLSTPLPRPSAIVDFLYHPDAEFWADHHLTTFLTPTAREDYEKRRGDHFLVFDQGAGSCATLLWNRLGSRIPHPERFTDSVVWAEKIDTANYGSVEEAIWGTSPASKIRLTLGTDSDPDYQRLLVRELRSGDVQRISQLPPVRDRFNEVHHRISQGLFHAARNTRMQREIAVMDIEAEGEEIISRYAPYHFFPRARYSIASVRSESSVTITAMRNPWIDFRSVPIGKILEPFGGGGHLRVGSVIIPKERAEFARTVVDRLMAEMQSHSSAESVIA
jgi:hypothetical protein